MSAAELSEDEAVKVAAFGLDSAGGAAADVAVAMLDDEIRRRPRPMNGDGSNYALGQLRQRIVRRYPDSDSPS